MNKKILCLLIFALFFLYLSCSTTDISNENQLVEENDENQSEENNENQSEENNENQLEEEVVEVNVPILEKVEWLNSNHEYGSACIRINGKKVIYIDPSGIFGKNTEIKADLILITHPHDDHFSIPTIKKILKDTTKIVTVKDCAELLAKEQDDKFDVSVVGPGDTITIDEIKIEAIPAYSKVAHDKANNWVGYLISIDDAILYHSGDTGLIPEMKNLKNIDIAFLTVRSPYMMSPKEVVEAAEIMRPKVLVPIHWIEKERRSIDYIVENAKPFTKVVILEKK